jgi:hypothetical protein
MAVKQDIMVQHRILIPLCLVCMPVVVSSAVFLSMDLPLVTVRFSPSEQLLGYELSFRHDGGEGGREKSGKEWNRMPIDQTKNAIGRKRRGG